MSRPATIAKARPAPTPAMAGFNPCHSISPITSCWLAPSAIRANLPRALADHIRNHAVNADSRKHDGEDGEQPEQQQIETRTSKLIVNELNHRARSDERKSRIEPSDDIARRRQHL
jgi:hypothetical protein